MMIAIVNITPQADFEDDPFGTHLYEVRINKIAKARFTHTRGEGLAVCLHRAAEAVEKESNPPQTQRLHLRLTDPGKNFYWHCHKRKKMPPIEALQADFAILLWPGKGLTWASACSIGEVAQGITKPGVYEVNCGEYQIEATIEP